MAAAERYVVDWMETSRPGPERDVEWRGCASVHLCTSNALERKKGKEGGIAAYFSCKSRVLSRKPTAHKQCLG